MTWPTAVLEHVRIAPDSLRALGDAGDPEIERWRRSELADEAGLEIWITRLFVLDRRAGVAAAAAAARHAYPIAIAGAGDEAVELGLAEGAPSMDGESEGDKVRRVEAWLASPDDAHFEAVSNAHDPSRQLEVWDDDLLPGDDFAWQWFAGVGQLCAAACVFDDGPAAGPFDDSSYHWPARLCAARCVVAAAKCLRTPNGDALPDIAAIVAAIRETFS